MLKSGMLIISCKVNIHESKFEFADEMKKKKFETPFPCNENWDKKAWRWLQKNHCTLKVMYYSIILVVSVHQKFGANEEILLRKKQFNRV